VNDNEPARKYPMDLRASERAVLRSDVAPVLETAADALVHLLAKQGVTKAFGLLGGAIAPFCRAIERSPITLVHCRHEAGAGFAAIEASIAADAPVVVFATTGPGLANAITPMIAARWEGARIVFVSGTTSTTQRGRVAFQETSPLTFPIAGLFTAGPVFHYAAIIESAEELETAAARLAAGLSRPGPFVAHLSIPLGVQSAPCGAHLPTHLSASPPAAAPAAIDECVRALAEGPFVVWLGFGARRAAPAVRALVERTGAHVMCSPRAKGIFPENHPLFLGVTGLTGDTRVRDWITRHRPERALVLGSRLGELSSAWAPELAPPCGFVHVDLDPDAFGAAYPRAPTIAIQADVGPFLDALLERWPLRSCAAHEIAFEVSPLETPPIPPRPGPFVRPTFLMNALQRLVVERSDAILLAEAGTAQVLGSQELRFASPGRYRVVSGFASMGHATAGVVGAAFGREGKAVALVGDGAMMMLSEVNTAVEHEVGAVWVVLNDARYGMIDHGMRSLGWVPFATGLPRADFVKIAHGLGAGGVRVENEAALEAALETALSASGPFVVDVWLDTGEAPMGWTWSRRASLISQGLRLTEGK
jgi:acetolactate synthase I/II/III large subunit